MANPQTIGNWANILEPILKAYFIDEYKKPTTVLPEIFSMETGTKQTEHYQSLASLDNFQKFDGTVVPASTPDVGYRLDLTTVEWAKAVDVSYALYLDEQYPIFKNLMGSMANSAKRTQEQLGIDIFNHAFDTTNVGGDTLALCSSAHTSTVAGVANQSNILTGALSYANFIIARATMRRFFDMAGNKILISPDILLVPVELETAAYELAESPDRPDTANRSISGVNKSYKPTVVISEFLTDTKNWFAISSEIAKKHNHYVMRTPLQLSKDQSPSTYIMRMSGYMRMNAGFSDWRFVIGSQCS